MKYPDLYQFPVDHPPSPYQSPLKVINHVEPRPQMGIGFLPVGVELRAIGWIEDTDFTTGLVPDAVLDKLKDAHQTNIFSDGTRGLHICCLCDASALQTGQHLSDYPCRGHGHYLLQHGTTVYMAPEMLLHYIIDHQYCPPKEFLDAVLNGHFMTDDDLEVKWER